MDCSWDGAPSSKFDGEKSNGVLLGGVDGFPIDAGGLVSKDCGLELSVPAMRSGNGGNSGNSGLAGASDEGGVGAARDEIC